MTNRRARSAAGSNLASADRTGVLEQYKARSARLARLVDCPTAASRSFPAAVNAQTATVH